MSFSGDYAKPAARLPPTLSPRFFITGCATLSGTMIWR
ncbi:hypothetical protein A4U88_4393 [Serratia marcescens]|nr:hypothetical protein A4U88_4393 [Serratia marcescens]AXK24556.1 Hypothetical protein SmN45_2795 [Serratia marcescens]CDJ77282.1 Hypothetical protein SMB2099_2668 [Serratia marcescens SMB2099]